MTAKVSGWYSQHRVKFLTHLSPALSMHSWQGTHQALPIPSNIWKGSQRKEEGKPSCESLVWATAPSRGTTTELKCQGARKGSHYGDQWGGHWPPTLAKSGLSPKRWTSRGGTWEEHGWVSHLPSQGAPVPGQNWVCTGPWHISVSQAG